MIASASQHIGRIGSVSYLNARPLIYGLEGDVQLETPSVLASLLRKGNLDAALVPVAEYLEYPHYQIVPGIAVGSRGPVKSVYLAHRKPLNRLKTIALDPASKTSNLLLQVILAEFFNLHPRYQALERVQKVSRLMGLSPLARGTTGGLPSGLTSPNPSLVRRGGLKIEFPGTFSSRTASCDARLLIGDPALLLRDRLLKKHYSLLDLGEVWQKKTGLPFVFAFWTIRQKLAVEPYLKLFALAKKQGLQHLDVIARKQTLLPKQAALSYLAQNVCYDLGARQKNGLLEFQRLCVQCGLISKTVAFKLL